MPRVLLFGAAWMAFLATLAVVNGLAIRPKVSSEAGAASVSPPAPPPKVGARYPGWTVTRAYSAHHMMVVEVETDGAATSTQIAAQIVEPLKGRYDEVLVYVRKPGEPADALPGRRVQWTRQGGYVESVYER